MTTHNYNTPQNYIFGRPCSYDIKALAKSVDDWSKDEDNWDLLKWLVQNELHPKYPLTWSKNDKDFCVAWNTAKMRIAARRTEMLHLGEFNPGIYHKYQHNYDVLAKLEDEEDKDREHERKKDLITHDVRMKTAAVQAISSDYLDKFNQFAAMFESYSMSAKQAITASITDTKSLTHMGEDDA